MILRSRTNIDHKSHRERERGTNRFNIDITFYATHFFLASFCCCWWWYGCCSIFQWNSVPAPCILSPLGRSISVCLGWWFFFFSSTLFLLMNLFVSLGNIVRSMAQVLPHDDSVDRFARERIIIQNNETKRNEMHFAKRHMYSACSETETEQMGKMTKIETKAKITKKERQQQRAYPHTLTHSQNEPETKIKSTRWNVCNAIYICSLLVE